MYLSINMDKLLSEIEAAKDKSDCVEIVKEHYIRALEDKANCLYDTFTHTAHSKGKGLLEQIVAVRRKQAEIKGKVYENNQRTGNELQGV